MSLDFITQFFYIDRLSIVIIILVSFIGFTTASFASRYLNGDSQTKKFFAVLGLLVGSVIMMVCADNLWLFLATWGLSNTLLVRLMIHKASWPAAKAAGLLAAKNFLLGFICLTSAFILLYVLAETTSIQAIVHHFHSENTLLGNILVILLVIAAMTQSAIWPCHRWLTSSLNSPTPVSAIMHAGLINGGGFLLARFAYLLLPMPHVLTLVFILGLITALIGTLWKLMQHDVKRMLACSTMGQMGFMLAQFGLGLFPAAIAHLCWHGLFKAYLFLASSSNAQEKRLPLDNPPSGLAFMLALVGGLLGGVSFAFMSHKSILSMDTNILLIVVTFITASQFSLTILRVSPVKRFLAAWLCTIIVTGLYGSSVYLFEYMLAPLNLRQAQPLNIIYLSGIALLFLAWLIMVFIYRPERSLPDWLRPFYVLALNSSQPHPSTITWHRNHYRY